ncbi:MAG: hypothetical protein QOJ67_3696 [Acidimicrobiaceae bacterium]
MPDPTPDPKKLDAVQREIDHARKAAQDAHVIDDPNEPKFHESGSIRPDLDDQEIAPG